jgi:Ca2+-binding RTX toxin-like protein
VIEVIYFQIMAIDVSTSTQLRTAIQNVTSSDPLINVADGAYTTITTLAKLPSYPSEPAVPFINGYTIDGTSQIGTVINDTRIYQQNVDGLYAPSTVQDLTLKYNSSLTNKSAILRATSGSYTLDNLLITGEHAGWAGNGGVYMALTLSNAKVDPITSAVSGINTNLTLKNSTIAVSGQVGSSAFLQSWNNSGNVDLKNNQFDEAGLNAGSFHFGTMYANNSTTGGGLGNYMITNNTFTRLSGPETPRSRGNRLETVAATVRGNTFSKGAFLDLYGDVSQVVISDEGSMLPADRNKFETVYGGSGIKFNKTTTAGVQLVSSGIIIQANDFSGYGLAITNNDSTPSSVIKISGQNRILTGSTNALPFVSFARQWAGGSGNNTITSSDTGIASNTKDWINAGSGADTIHAGGGEDYIIGGAGVDNLTGGTGADTFVYYDSTEGQDTITDFATASDCLAFRGNTSGGSSFFNFAPGASLTSGTNFITSGASATNAVPTFIYFGGVLSYDADGSGGGAAVNIATFTGSPTIAASDIKFF